MSNPYRDKLLGIGVISRRTRNEVRDVRRPDGERAKATTDELGNTVTESAERQDVHIRAPHLTIKARTTEEKR